MYIEELGVHPSYPYIYKFDEGEMSERKTNRKKT